LLFVGVRPYTRALTRSVRNATVVTIDRDPNMRFFGARRHHTVALEDIAGTHEGPFDVAIVNGVFGAGIDSVAAAERAIKALYTALGPGGLLVLGVNEERPTTPSLSRVKAMHEFRLAAPPPWGTPRFVVSSPFEGTHTFLFFQRASTR